MLPAIACSVLMAVLQLTGTIPDAQARASAAAATAGWLGEVLRLTATAVPQPITAPGKYVLHDGRVAVEVRDAGADRCHLAVCFTIDGNAPHLDVFATTATPLKGADWFVYPGSDGCVWAFDGKGELLKFTWKECATSAVNPKLVAEAPEVVRNRLPEEFIRSVSGQK
jgi:hypothetical protein